MSLMSFLLHIKEIFPSCHHSGIVTERTFFSNHVSYLMLCIMAVNSEIPIMWSDQTDNVAFCFHWGYSWFYISVSSVESGVTGLVFISFTPLLHYYDSTDFEVTPYLHWCKLDQIMPRVAVLFIFLWPFDKQLGIWNTPSEWDQFSNIGLVYKQTFTNLTQSTS